ncbi:hypothetical protein QAD02_009202 [Eretmocerus hayati]|uniref:Uncharacterized protein n=1 Tax=Eretmocerus hayati TaxID=131215 RepID=A0ACC2N8K3_9HYME|nr:hypothetical protein QAD02_009202 [Eretmocerus hayati]
MNNNSSYNIVKAPIATESGELNHDRMNGGIPFQSALENQNQSSDSSSILDDQGCPKTSPTSLKWSEAMIKLLPVIYKEHKTRWESGRFSTKTMFLSKIAEDMKVLGYILEPSQIQSKLFLLEENH